MSAFSVHADIEQEIGEGYIPGTLGFPGLFRKNRPSVRYVLIFACGGHEDNHTNQLILMIFFLCADRDQTLRKAAKTIGFAQPYLCAGDE